jgi:hypothetical protein
MVAVVVLNAADHGEVALLSQPRLEAGVVGLGREDVTVLISVSGQIN